MKPFEEARIGRGDWREAAASGNRAAGNVRAQLVHGPVEPAVQVLGVCTGSKSPPCTSPASLPGLSRSTTSRYISLANTTTERAVGRSGKTSAPIQRDPARLNGDNCPCKLDLKPILHFVAESGCQILPWCPPLDYPGGIDIILPSVTEFRRGQDTY